MGVASIATAEPGRSFATRSPHYSASLLTRGRVREIHLPEAWLFLREQGARSRPKRITGTIKSAQGADDITAPLVAVLGPAQQLRFGLLIGLWLTTVVGFWIWWCQASHIVGWMRFTINSVLLSWTLLLPGYFFFFVSRMRMADPRIAIPDHWRVAMVVTKAPSEPFSVVRRTLQGMLAQRRAHDTWLADEEPAEEVVQWCLAHGVSLCSRKGIGDYHRSEWPRRARCKEGNLAYFYDTYGYDAYDFVVQLDADHRPEQGYLEAMLRPFVDRKVGYVSAPSICDSNAAQSWIARARLFSEAIMHGPLQAGYSAGFAPLCIGSHYAVRTAALKEVGGLGPELDEDHSTTLMLNAAGWKGVHALDAQAHGEGPQSFADCMTQEFQWSRSLTTLLLSLTPRLWHRLPPRLLCQFLFSQLWYPIFGSVMLLCFVLPLIAICTRTPWVRVSYAQFLVGAILVNATLIAIMAWLRRNGLLRPQRSKLMSWEMLVFQLARWPWVILGIAAGIYGSMRRKTWEFQVTRKGNADRERLPRRFVLLPALLALLTSLMTVMVDAGEASGYYFFSILNGLAYCAVAGVIMSKHRGENGTRHTTRGRMRMAAGWALVGGVLLLVPAALWLRGPDAWRALGGGTAFRSEPGVSALTGADHLAAFRLGVYDPDELLEGRDWLDLEHVFVSWAEVDRAWLEQQLAAIRSRNRVPLITLEPWPSSTQKMPSDQLFQDILVGVYDPAIDAFAEALKSADTLVYIRWGHEMDNLAGPYPWITENHAAYVEAYRYVVDRLRSRVDDCAFVWSPAGNTGCADYWPGDEYVDVVGLSILNFPSWEWKQYGRVRSFAEMFSEKYDRIRQFDHPVMIAEFGVTGSNGHQKEWLRQAFEDFADYPLLRSVVIYFSRDVDGVWGADLPTPDWRFRLTMLEEARRSLRP